MTVDRTFLLHAMDPGRTTGLALMEISPIRYSLLTHTTTRHDPESGASAQHQLREWRERHPDMDHVFVYESFHVRPGILGVDTTAIEVISDTLAWVNDTKPYDYTVAKEPVQGKHLVTDQVLKNAGLWTAGPEARHVRDALRHAVAHLQQIRHLPLCRAAWPPRSAQSLSPSERRG